MLREGLQAPRGGPGALSASKRCLHRAGVARSPLGRWHVAVTQPRSPAAHCHINAPQNLQPWPWWHKACPQMSTGGRKRARDGRRAGPAGETAAQVGTQHPSWCRAAAPRPCAASHGHGSGSFSLTAPRAAPPRPPASWRSTVPSTQHLPPARLADASCPGELPARGRGTRCIGHGSAQGTATSPPATALGKCVCPEQRKCGSGNGERNWLAGM